MHKEQPPQPQREGLRPLLGLPVPPMLEQAIGYEGQARFVSFFWTPIGDEAYYDDGRMSGVGNWDGYLAFVDHPVIAPHLQPFHLGSSETEAVHHLVLDRKERTLSVAPVARVRAVVTQQWAGVPLPTMQEGTVQDLLDALDTQTWQERGAPEMEAIRQKMHQHQQLLSSMQDWLASHYRIEVGGDEDIPDSTTTQPSHDEHGRRIISWHELW